MNFQGHQDLLEFAENDVEMADHDASNWIDKDNLNMMLAVAPQRKKVSLLAMQGEKHHSNNSL